MAYVQVGDTCYPSELAGNQAIASSQLGKLVQVGTASYVVDATNITATNITYTLRNVANTATIVKTSVVTPIPCQALTALDAADIAWKIAAVWIAVYAIMFVTRSLRGVDQETTYGTA